MKTIYSIQMGWTSIKLRTVTLLATTQSGPTESSWSMIVEKSSQSKD
jgi:hypothetical protein